ncbi:MAG: hypothetical protein FJ271_23915 [Planctomycetes bacterium]|nr:hypothetical protein [Planctomycetota bacterium]
MVALFIPAVLFPLGLWCLSDHPRFHWLCDIKEFPWELWIIATSGLAATVAGVADWRWHRSGRTAIGAPEHHDELLALLGGGLPLFGLMVWASFAPAPHFLLIPILLVALFTVVLICHDEFVFHRKRCGRYETVLHRVLVFGNGTAWLAWMNWCFVRGGGHG